MSDREPPQALSCTRCAGAMLLDEEIHEGAVIEYQCDSCGWTGRYVRERLGHFLDAELPPVGFHGPVSDGRDGELPDEWREAQMIDYIPFVGDVIEDRDRDTGVLIHSRIDSDEWIRTSDPELIEQ